MAQILLCNVSSSVQVGTQCTITYNWSGPTNKPYVAFVHFVNSSGQNSLGGNDHNPPVNSNEWTQDIYSYESAFVVPSTAPVGKYSIRAGLYDPSTGQRIPLESGSGVKPDGEVRYTIGELNVVPATVVVSPTSKSEVYVSPTGNDTGQGTKQSPFRTLQRAKSYVRTISKTNPVTVYLRGGVYNLESPLVFGPEDSGNTDLPVTWTGYPGERVVFSGLKIYKPVSITSINNIYTVNFQANMPRFQDLYVNKKIQPRSRFPHNGWISIESGQSNSSCIYSSVVKVPTMGLTAPNMVVQEYEWSESRLPVSTIDTVSRKVITGKPSVYNLKPYNGLGRFYLENLRDGIYNIGQWCLHRDSNTVTYYGDPNTPITGLEFSIPIPITLLTIEGTQQSPVQHLVFKNITFTNTKSRVKSVMEGGITECQAVRITQNSQNIKFESCNFEKLGGGGIACLGRTNNIDIVNCSFFDIGENAISVIGEPGNKPQSYQHLIYNNKINNCGTLCGQSYAIEISMSASNEIFSNIIVNVPYCGIRINGQLWQSWNKEYSPNLTVVDEKTIKPYIPTKNNTIRDNIIINSLQRLRDGGAIYTWGVMGGVNYIRNNEIINVGVDGGPCVGLYCDDQSDDFIIELNKVKYAMWGVHLHGSSRIIFKENIIAFSKILDISIQPENYVKGPLENVIENNVFYMGQGTAVWTQWGDWSVNPIKSMDYNHYWRNGDSVQLLVGRDTNSSVVDPKFIDPLLEASYDYHIGSPAK